MSVIYYWREKIADCWDEGKDLILKNNAETGAVENEKFNPSLERYRQIEDLGMLRLFTMRDGSKLIGYCVMFVTPSLHYPDTTWAHQDVLYVVPEWRGFAAVKFLRFIDRQLKNDGVDFVMRQVTEKKDFSRTLERMGYEVKETNYVRRF